MSWNVDDVPDQTGRRIVITGANSGIGFEAAKVLVRKGARVVMACRSLDRGEAAAKAVRASIRNTGETNAGDVVVRRLDLADLESVTSFPKRLELDDYPIDVLVNNAGIMGIPRRETEDGFERQFGVNHLGHFALTGTLVDSLDDDARVVTVSSGMHERGEIDFEDLHGEESYGKWDAYAQSKLANLLFAYELDRRVEDAEVDITSVGVHPGYADTSLQSRGPEMTDSAVRKVMMRAANAVFAQPAADGALPTLYAATASDVQGGEYYGPGGFFTMRGPPERQRSSERSYDREAARRLWEVSAELTGVEFGLRENRR
ncbi:oxidoreductase [Halalkaliarchaeum sp. AArc-GB]|uniref:oxidoreductase n=1 Tax=Halalkaliarchaeum sp. AArc-GB TaxID=3074078 RepID=UPI002858ACE9|nr:oxidoreductase [Halalkaliarchaeum sp. AArc-GB]MDR5672798.1 oxidoreductase [Halalkaliarchaeum sp. AArc-GB]